MTSAWLRIVCLFFLLQNILSSGRINRQALDEDDEVLADAIPTIPLQEKRQYIHEDQNVGNLAENIVSEVPTRRSTGSDAANIVGDVNKYGLWEYTSDNTGMGDQIKSLMNKENSADVFGGISSHALENQGRKMNEKIDKYAEDSLESAPNIDPMETPQQYHTATQDSQQQKQQSMLSSSSSSADTGVDGSVTDSQKFTGHDDQLSFVSIPSTMTIEDEHGQHLDTVNMDSTREMVKEDFDGKPTSSALKAFTGNSHSGGTTKAIAAILQAAKAHPTHSLLTARLLKAMQKSSVFRKHAEELLPTDSDSDIDLFQKERQLATFLKEYENKDEKQAMQPDLKLKIPSYNKEDDVSIEKEREPGEGKVLNVIKKLIHDDYSTRDEEGKVLHELLNTLKTSEEDENKMESDFQDGHGGGGGVSLSSPYLNHFKEFLQKQKQANIKEEATDSTDDVQHPLGTEGSPLKGYLEQEASSVNRFHESGSNPNIDLQRLQTLLAIQEGKHVSVEDQNEKLLNEELKKLLNDKAKSEGKIKELKEFSGDEKDTLNQYSTKEDSTSSEKDGNNEKSTGEFDNAILDYIKHSKRFKNLLKQQQDELFSKEEDDKKDGDEPTKGNGESNTKVSGEDKSSKEPSRDEPLSVQLKEIELQREILNLEEKKLKNRDKDKEIKKKITKLKADEKVDHLFHLANPLKTSDYAQLESGKEDKTASSSSSSSSENNSKTDKKIEEKSKDSLEKAEDKDSSSEQKHKEDADTPTKSSFDSSPPKLSGEKVEQKENHKSEDNEKSEKNSPTASSKKDSGSSNQKSLTGKSASSTESPKLDMVISSVHHSFYKKERPGSSNPFARKYVSDVIKEDVEEKLGLPINNPKPDTDSTFQPNAFFHYVRPNPFQYGSTRTVLTPLHFSKPPAPSLMNITSSIESSKSKPSIHHSAPSLINITSPLSNENTAAEISTSLSQKAPSLMNFTPETSGSKRQSPTKYVSSTRSNKAVGVTEAHHHNYPIMEPPPLNAEKFSTSSLISSDRSETIQSPSPLTSSFSPLKSSANDGIVSNLLKHKSIPTVLDALRGSIPSVRFIRPKSSSVDVKPSKKSFGGKLPLKPKEYLLQELKADLKLLTSKRHFINKSVSHEVKHKVFDDKKNSTGFSTLHPVKTLVQNATKINTPGHQLPVRKGVLVPYKRNVTLLTPGDYKTVEKHHLVPPTSKSTSKNSTKNNTIESRSTISLSRTSNNAKTNSEKETPENIEDVFNILQSEDQS